MPVSIEKSGDLVGCHHSGTTNKKGKIGLLSQWTMDGWDEQMSKKKKPTSYCSPTGEVVESKPVQFRPPSLATIENQLHWLLRRERCWKPWKCPSSTLRSSSSAGRLILLLPHGNYYYSCVFSIVAITYTFIGPYWGIFHPRGSHIHSRDTIDSVFGYSYSKMVKCEMQLIQLTI